MGTVLSVNFIRHPTVVPGSTDSSAKSILNGIAAHVNGTRFAGLSACKKATDE